MDPSFRTRRHELRSDSFLRLRLGWRQRNEEIVERGSCARATTHFEKKYKKTEGHRQKQCGSSTVRSGIGSVRSERVQSTTCDLGFAVKPVLIIDAKATEHILHRHELSDASTDLNSSTEEVNASVLLSNLSVHSTLTSIFSFWFDHACIHKCKSNLKLRNFSFIIATFQFLGMKSLTRYSLESVGFADTFWSAVFMLFNMSILPLIHSFPLSTAA